MTLKIRPLKGEDLKEFKNYGKSVRGLVVESDGEVIGVAGVLHTVPLQAFSSMKDDLRKHPKWIMKMIYQFRDILSKYDVPVYAKASETEANSTKVLERVGFEHVNGRIYEWQIR